MVIGNIVPRSSHSSGLVLSGKSAGKTSGKSEGKGDGTIAVGRTDRGRKMSSEISSMASPRIRSPPLESVDEPMVPDDITDAPHWDVLIVDDSPLNRKMLMRTLRAAGHIVEDAGDGREGITMVQHRVDNSMKPYDVILMDFVMPGMDGPTATKVDS